LIGPFEPKEAIMGRTFAKTFLPVAFLGVLGSSERAFASDTLSVKWNDVLLQSVRSSKLGPPMVARAIGIVHTCGFDAWAAYDDVAVGTRLGSSLRRPAAERRPTRKP
jgi:hypothetical protein